MKGFFANLFLIITLQVQGTVGWIPQITIRQLKKQIIEHGVLATIIVSQSAFLPSTAANAFVTNHYSNESPGIYSGVLLSSTDSVDESLSQILKQPTDVQPQIMLPKGADILQRPPDGRSPIIQGLVYLKDPESSRPDFSDNLVITVTSSSSQQTLAGAKIPVTKVRFPSQFNLYKENILPAKVQEWESTIASKDDIFVNAKICPESSISKVCSDGESTFQARGISKVVKNLPGMRDGDIVRTAASLGL